MKRLYLIVLCVLLAASASAQKKKKPSGYNKQNNENEQFLQKQWWLGFKAGTNLSDATVGKTYSVLSPVNYDPSLTGKKYQNFNRFGTQAALEVTFSYKKISISLQPTYRRASFVYTNNYEWTDSQTASNKLTLTYEQEQKIDHAEIPLVIKYEMGNHRLRPYLQLGGFAAFLINANKSVTVSGVDYASGGKDEFQNPAIIVGAKDLFAKNYWGLIGGAGLNYHLGNVRFNLDIMYKYGMSNITSTKNRYSNDRLSGVGDALDDIKLNNLAISLGCLFPLRFLGSGFKSIDK
jgi:outer membrane protein W